jgi:Ca2+-binding EF-hand superfamily protein
MVPRARAISDHRDRSRCLTSLTLCCVLLTAGTAAAWAQLLSPQELRPLFLRTDQNRDGTIERQEFSRRSIEQFYVLDKERKGYLLPEDVTALLPEDFTAANRKGDGKLSLDEFLNARLQQFDRADSNGDGVLTLQEFEVYMTRMR